MSNTIALQVDPDIYDLARIDQSAQRYQENELDLAKKRMENDLYAAKSQNDIADENALARYRFKKEKGGSDTDAMKELRGNPALQKKLYDAFDGMSPEEFGNARNRARAFGKAAQYVSQFPDGSPQRVEAWNAVADDLLKQGVIDENTARMMKEGGPNDLLIDQALTVDEYTSKYAGPKGAKDRATIAKTDAQISLTQAREADIGIDNSRADSRTGTQNELDRARKTKVEADTTDIGTDNARADSKTAAEIRNLDARGDAALIRAKTRTSPGAKGGREDLNTMKGVNELLKQKAAVLGLGADGSPDISDVRPDEEQQAAADAFQEYRKALYDQFDMTPDGMPRQRTQRAIDSAQGGDGGAGGGSPTGQGTRADPVQINSQKDFDALAPGAYFINPADGRLMRKRQG